MPLHADDPVFMRLVLDRFDHTVGSDGCDAQAVTQIPDGLVMRSVYFHCEATIALFESAGSSKLSQFTAKFDSGGVHRVERVCGKASPAVLDVRVQIAGNVLVESAAEGDVQGLAAVADAENRVSGSRAVLMSGEIRLFALRVRALGLFV